MYRNQYLVTNSHQKWENKEFKSVPYETLRIYFHESLNITTTNNFSTSIALIGYIIDPLNPSKSNRNIVDDIAKNCTTIEQFHQQTQLLSGRYVLLFKNNTSFVVSGDACNFRQIYYSVQKENITITSSPKLFLDFFNYDLKTTKEKRALINSDIFKKLEYSWFGNESIDNRLNKLLPNYRLNLISGEAERIPFYQHVLVNKHDVLNYSASVLKGTYSALSNRYTMLQPLTAGWDSRILLAASKNYSQNITYYVFDRSSTPPQDTRIPDNLSKEFNLTFNTIAPPPLRESWIKGYQKEHIVSRILPKTANIQYYYDSDYENNVININGNAAEICRCFYGYTKKNVTKDMLLTFSGYHYQSPYIDKQIGRWFDEIKNLPLKNFMSVLDLFYWEQRMGNWGARYPYEQDIAIEEFSPFNNRSLILSLLKISPKRRKAPNYQFFGKLIEKLWRETSIEKINPDENYLKKIVKGNAYLRYLAQKARFKLPYINT